MAITSNPAIIRAHLVYRSSTSFSESWFRPPDRLATWEPAGACALSAAEAAARDLCFFSPSRSPGMVASASSWSGCAEYTPETTGATRFFSTLLPIRARTSSPRVFALAPTEAGRALSSLARRSPARPSTPSRVLSSRLPGIPIIPVFGVLRAPKGRYSHEPCGLGVTICSPRPSSLTSSETMGERVA